jgi:prepilin-type N-terminal cleavage/methylation domain-containing protein
LLHNDIYSFVNYFGFLRITMPSTQKTENGFSLVELAIVLVILGLLVGGVLGGQSLIRASELRSLTTEREQFYTALRSFREKYMALPGDMTTATSFWGTNATCPAADYAGTATCNGDGDELINGSVNFDGGTGWQTYDPGEFALFWQHLGNAGLIATKPEGTALYTSAIYVRGKLANAVWIPFSLNPGDGISLTLNYIHINQDQTLLRPEEMWNIDTKIDDGKPGTGKMILGWYNVILSDPSACTDSATLDANSVYRLTSTQIACNATFTNM